MKFLTDLEIPLVRINPKKVGSTSQTTGETKWRRVPLEKWKGVSYTDRTPKDFKNACVAVQTGCALGNGKNLYILDIDLKKQEGHDSLTKLEEQHGKIETWKCPISKTESGGFHCWFSSEEDLPVVIGILPGVDFLGKGALSFEPPSKFFEGAKEMPPYEWINAPKPSKKFPAIFPDILAHVKLKALAREEKLASFKAHDENTFGSLTLADAPFIEKCFSLYTPENGLEYSHWLRIGMALHDASNGAEEFFEIFDAWGYRVAYEKGGDYSDKKTLLTWESFGKRSGDLVTYGTLVRILLEEDKVNEFIKKSISSAIHIFDLVENNSECVSDDFSISSSCSTDKETSGERYEKDYGRTHKTTHCDDERGYEEIQGGGFGENNGVKNSKAPVFTKKETQVEEDLLLEFSGETTKRSLALSDEQSRVISHLETSTASGQPQPTASTETVEGQEKKKVKKAKTPRTDKIEYLVEEKLTKAVESVIGGPIKYNELTGKIEVKLPDYKQLEVLTDVVESKVVIRCRDFGKAHNVVPLCKEKDVLRAMSIIADRNRYNPIKDYLNKCLDNYRREKLVMTVTQPNFSRTYYRDHLIAGMDLVPGEATEFFAKALDFWLKGAICKAFKGFQNPMLVLQGKQGSGKSTLAKSLVKELPPSFYHAGAINPDDKDHKIRMASLFIWEPDELGGTTNRVDINSLKSMLTLNQINERMPYAKYQTSLPVMCSFLGTVNDSTFLQDTTGSRRFLITQAEPKNATNTINFLRGTNFNPGLLWGEVYNEVEESGDWAPLLPEELRIEAEYKAEEVRVKSYLEELLDETLVITKDPNDTVTRKQIREMLIENRVPNKNGLMEQVTQYISAKTGRKAKDVCGHRGRGADMTRLFFYVKLVGASEAPIFPGKV